MAAVTCAAIVATAPAAAAAPRDTSSEKLRKSVTRAELVDHLEAFQGIADANGGTRATGTPGYEASVDYVAGVLEDAGYDVERVPFDFPTWQENGTPTLSWNGTSFVPGTAANDDDPAVDFITFEFSGSGSLSDVPVVPVDVMIHSSPDSLSTSGCEASDYPAAVEGAIALIQRGTCPFVQKLDLARDAGAVGVLLFNEGNTAGRRNALYRGATPYLGIPALFIDYDLGKALYDAYQAGSAPRVSLSVDATTTARFFDNVVAYSRTGDPSRTVMLGAHLDSVPEGPGVNDNGSGAATLLEIAEGIAQLAKNKNKGSLTNRVAFAFWGAEEFGLIGSTYFVEHLTDAQRANIMANLNFDMMASRNFARLVYDGDGSSFGLTGPAGSDVIEHVFNQYFESQGLAYEATDFSGRSDYGPFIAAGIPAGGLFTGAEEPKTPEQQERYGGVAGVWLDPCYHQACDTLATLLGSPPPDADGFENSTDPAADAAALAGNGIIGFDQMADAAAHATWYLTMKDNPLSSEPTLTLGKRAGKKGKSAKPSRSRRAKRTRRQGVQLEFKGTERVQR